MKLEIRDKTSPSTAANILMISGVTAAFHLGKAAPTLPALHLPLGLTSVQAAFLLSLMQVSGAILGLLFGLVGNVIGAKRCISTGQLILCLTSFTITGVDTAESLLSLRALESLGFLLIVLPTPGLIRKVVTNEQMAFRLGLWGGYISIGTSLSFAAGPYFIGWLGWKAWWAAPGFVSAICFLLIYIYVPTDHTQRHDSIRNLSFKPVWQVFKHLPVWLVGVAFAMYSGQWIAVVGFLPTIYAKTGITSQNAGVLTAIAALSNVVGNLISAYLLKNGTREYPMLLTGFISMMLTSFIAFSTVTTDLPILRYLAIVIFSAAGGLIPATLFNLAVTSTPDSRNIAISIGWIQQLTSLGMLITPPIMAAVAQHVGGWQYAWVVTSITGSLGLVLSIYVLRK